MQYNLSAMDKRIQQLERQIEKVKTDLVELGDLRPGSLSEQYNVCGTPGCRCKASPPEKHGPYYQLSFTRNGRSSSRFVRREELADVKKQVRNHTRLRELVKHWIELATELSDLRIAEKKEAK
jgi:hypothetical protein